MIPTPISEEANDDDHETSEQDTIKPRRSTRVRSAPEWYGNPVLEVMLLDHDEPTNYEEAMVSPDSAKWLEAMKSEMGSMYENKGGLWLTCPMIGKQLRINGSSRRRLTLTVILLSTKLDLSQKVFRQVQGVEYNEIFSLVSMLKSIRIMLAIATFYEIWQMDVKTTFLNGFIKEELYMMQPEGFCQS